MPIPKDRADEIVRAYISPEEGARGRAGVNSLAERFGHCPNTVRRVLARADVARKPPGRPWPQKGDGRGKDRTSAASPG